MKKLLIWLVLRKHYDNTYAWQLSGLILQHAKYRNMQLSIQKIISYI